MSNIGKQAPFLDGIRYVTSSAQRDVLFPSPDTNQRVQNAETGYIERYDGATWQQEVPIVAVAASPFLNVKAAPYSAKGDGVTDDTAAINAVFAAANPALDGGTGATHGAQIYLPPGIYMVSSMPTIPPQTRVFGGGRNATTIRATSGFTFSNGTTGNVAVIHLHGFGSRVEHLSIDGGGRANSVGIWSDTINEQSGAFHVNINGVIKYGVYIDSSTGANPIAQTYELEDLEIYPPAGATNFVGIYVNGSGSPPRRIRGVTVFGDDSAGSVGLSLQGTQFHLEDIHVEHVITGVNLGTVAAASGSIVDVLRVNNCTTGITIGANGNGMNSYQLRGVVNSGSVTTLVNDLVRTYTNTGSFEPFYAYGAGGTPNYLTSTNAPFLANGVSIGGGNLTTKVQIYQQTITPAAVSATTQAEQTFTVTGLTTNDHLLWHAAGPIGAAGLSITNVRVSATNTVAITFQNTTGGSLTPTSQQYTFIAFRF